jgi:hypothetical protein
MLWRRALSRPLLLALCSTLFALRSLLLALCSTLPQERFRLLRYRSVMISTPQLRSAIALEATPGSISGVPQPLPRSPPQLCPPRPPSHPRPPIANAGARLVTVINKTNTAILINLPILPYPPFGSSQKSDKQKNKATTLGQTPQARDQRTASSDMGKRWSAGKRLQKSTNSLENFCMGTLADVIFKFGQLDP